jgi:hypothetical protein
MSAEYKGQNPLDIAKQAEADLNSRANVQGRDPNTANPKHGAGVSDSGTSSPTSTVVKHLLTTYSTRVRYR